MKTRGASLRVARREAARLPTRADLLDAARLLERRAAIGVQVAAMDDAPDLTTAAREAKRARAEAWRRVARFLRAQKDY
jgi:dienelactone hydrolase